MEKINNNNAIQLYLNYLKDVSRKISISGGFENVLTKSNTKKKLYALQIKDELKNDGKLVFVKNMDLNKFKYLKEIDTYLNNNVDKKLFFGSGLICGNLGNNKSSKKIAGPLLIAECEIIKDEDKNQENQIVCDIKLSTLVFNYDLLSYILDRKYVSDSEDSEEFNYNLIKEAKIIDDIEKMIENVNNVFQIKELTKKFLKNLKMNWKNLKM